MSNASNEFHKSTGKLEVARVLASMVRGEVAPEARGIELMPEIDEVIAFIAKHTDTTFDELIKLALRAASKEGIVVKVDIKYPPAVDV